MSFANREKQLPVLWEKVVSVLVGVFIFGVVAYLVLRNQPFHDPNLVVILRIVLSVSAAVLGATIPGFLRLDWRAKGIAIRSGGALTLFLVTFIWSPTVVQSPNSPPPPPLASGEILTLRAQGFTFAGQIRNGFGPAAASAFKADIEPIAKKVWADERYEQQAPHESALIYRLYGATMILQRPADDNILKVIKDALPWVAKAVLLDDNTGDHEELEKSLSFLGQVAQGKIESIELSMMLRHQFRVALPGAKPEEIEKHVESTMQLVKEMVAPPSGGSSARDNLDFLIHQKLGTVNIGQVMEVMRLTLMGKFPNVDVGGQPIFIPLPNGNTLVQYKLNNGTKTLVYEWEVNKRKGLTIPRNAVTQELMTLRFPQSGSKR